LHSNKGGKFDLSITLPQTYPFKPPTVTFGTKIYHPNISNDSPPNSGTMCLGMLKDSEWKPSTKMAAVLEFARQLLKGMLHGHVFLLHLLPTLTTTWPMSLLPFLRPGPVLSCLVRRVSRVGTIHLSSDEKQEWIANKVSCMAEPNPDDAVEAKIAEQYRDDRAAYEKEAKEWVKRYASGKK
jgi:ubiquitin-protein ligase